MKTVKIFLLISLSFFFFNGCGGIGRDYQNNLEKLDKVYGKCDNPQRELRPIEYKICKDKEKAAGPDGEIGEAINVTEMFSNPFGGSGQGYVVSDTNNHLWDASLKMLSPYSIKISDFEGGFIETNWIQKQSLPNERCLIKAHITSKELISTGVEINVVCERLFNSDWYLVEEDFASQEKQLTLKILSEASLLSESDA
tara:strand:- start:1837 stop:2430 length:594 start_codon:yes stop_codon:yes gene_type:complete